MTAAPTYRDHRQFLHTTNKRMLIILVLMVACFFTWSENVLITRAIKVIGRMGVLYASYLVYRSIIQYGAVNSLKWQNVFAILFYLAYLLLGFASLMWSTDVGYSALQWFMTTQTLIFCFFFIKSLYLLDAYFPDHPIRLYNLLGNAAFLLQLVFVVGIWVAPDVFFRMTHGGEEARLGGYMMNPNELGMLAGLGIASLLFDLKRKEHKIWTLVKLLILLYALMATGSRSSLIGVMLIFGFHIKQSNHVRLKIAAIAISLVVAPIAVKKVIFKDGDSSRMEEVMSMTGRLPFWKALINEGLPLEPWLGFGFMRIAYKDHFQGRHTYPGKMTHNTFIQVLMNLGFVGLTLVILQMAFTIRAIAKEDDEKRLMLFSFLIPLLINSLTEFGIFGESNYGILFYQLVIAYICFYHDPRITRQQHLHLKKHRPELQGYFRQQSGSPVYALEPKGTGSYVAPMISRRLDVLHHTLKYKLKQI